MNSKLSKLTRDDVCRVHNFLNTPGHMIDQDAEELAYKCDYCGGDPACVKECVPSAIVFRYNFPVEGITYF